MSSNIKFRTTEKNLFKSTKEYDCQTMLTNSNLKEKINNDKVLISSLFYDMTSKFENKLTNKNHSNLTKKNYKFASAKSAFTPVKHKVNEKVKLQRCSSSSSINSVNSCSTFSPLDELTSLTLELEAKNAKSTSILHWENKAVAPISYIYLKNVQSSFSSTIPDNEKLKNLNEIKQPNAFQTFYDSNTKIDNINIQKDNGCNNSNTNDSTQNKATKRKKKPYKELTLEEKVQLIRLAEQNSTLSQACIAERYEIAKSNVCRILQRKKEYLRAYESAGFSGSRKRKLRSSEEFDKSNQKNKYNPEQKYFNHVENENNSKINMIKHHKILQSFICKCCNLVFVDKNAFQLHLQMKYETQFITNIEIFDKKKKLDKKIYLNDFKNIVTSSTKNDLYSNLKSNKNDQFAIKLNDFHTKTAIVNKSTKNNLCFANKFSTFSMPKIIEQKPLPEVFCTLLSHEKNKCKFLQQQNYQIIDKFVLNKIEQQKLCIETNLLNSNCVSVPFNIKKPKFTQNVTHFNSHLSNISQIVSNQFNNTTTSKTISKNNDFNLSYSKSFSDVYSFWKKNLEKLQSSNLLTNDNMQLSLLILDYLEKKKLETLNSNLFKLSDDLENNKILSQSLKNDINNNNVNRNNNDLVKNVFNDINFQKKLNSSQFLSRQINIETSSSIISPINLKSHKSLSIIKEQGIDSNEKKHVLKIQNFKLEKNCLDECKEVGYNNSVTIFNKFQQLQDEILQKKKFQEKLEDEIVNLKNRNNTLYVKLLQCREKVLLIMQFNQQNKEIDQIFNCLNELLDITYVN